MFKKFLSNVLCVNPFHHQMVTFVSISVKSGPAWTAWALFKEVLCVNLYCHQMVNFFEAASICVKSDPAWTAWALSKDVQFMPWAFAKKASFHGVMLICDKALSSSLPQIMEGLITFVLLIDVINLQVFQNDFFYLWAKEILSLPNCNEKSWLTMCAFNPKILSHKFSHDSCVLIFSRDFQMILQKYLNFHWSALVLKCELF